MKRIFTLAIIAMIATLSFAQAPVAVKSAAKKQIQKVMTTQQLQKGQAMKAAYAEKAKAAQETSGSILRHAQRPATGTTVNRKAELKTSFNTQVARQIAPAKVRKFKNAADKNLRVPAKANLSKMATAKTEAGDYDLELTATDYSADYDPELGDWFCVLMTSVGPFRFDIVTNSSAPLDGTYTYAQMDPQYSWVGTQAMGWSYQDATFTVNAEGTEVDASVTLSTGEKVHVTYSKPEVPEITDYKTFEFSVEETSLNDQTAFGVLQISADNGEQYASVAFYTDNVVGTYTIDDAYMTYTNLYLDANDYTGVKPFAINATVTEDGATVIYDGYDGTEYTLIFHFAEGGQDDPQPQGVTVTKDANGIITNVEGGEARVYTRSADAFYAYVSNLQQKYAYQSGNIQVVVDGNDFYIKDIICDMGVGTWVKGTLNEDGTKLVIPAGQMIYWSAQGGYGMTVNYGDYVANSWVMSDSDITYTVDGNTLTLDGAHASVSGGYINFEDAVLGAFWTDDNSFAGYGEWSTVLTYDPEYVGPSYDLVELPDGAQTADWYLNGSKVSDSSTTAVKNQAIKTAFVGDDVYAQGVFADFPTAWIKGTISGSTVTFAKGQYIGKYGTNDMWFMGVNPSTGDLMDATAAYDASKNEITLATDILANGKPDAVYYLSWLQDVVLSKDAKQFEEPTITTLTATLPYANGFDTEAEQAEAAIYDANGDGKTFTFADDSNTGSTTARYDYCEANNGDDYVVFPGLTLEAGKSYKVAVDARSYSEGWSERLEVVAGTVAKASELNISVIKPTDIASGEYITLNAEFKPEADGVYYFAIHAISDANVFWLYTDNFSVKELDPNAPVAPANLVVTPDSNADLSATIEFNAPAKNLAGEDIQGDVSCVVKRDGEILFGNVTVPAGQLVQLMDSNVPAPGFYTYSVTATVGELTSDAVSAKVYVGEDTPDDVENLVATDLNGKVGLSWDAVTEGINGGIIIPENVRYNVYPVEMVDFYGMQFPAIDFETPYATELEVTQAEVEYDTNAGAQQYTYFGVTASNAAGESMGAMAAVLTGAPYELPMHESFDNGLSYWWGVDYNEAIELAQGGLTLTVDGELAYVAPVEGWIKLMSGKVALNGAENPALKFNYKAEDKCSLLVQVVTPEGEEVIGMLPVEASEKYTTATIMLDAYADQPWVRFNLIGEFEGENYLFVDDIHVLDMVAHDLSIALSAPKTLTAGKSAVVKATVLNMGQEVAENYEVKFYVNDQELPTPLFETLALAFYESAEFETEFAASVFNEAGDITVKAEVVYAEDVKSENNADETLVALVAPSVTPVQSVAAEATAEGIVVNWTVAENTAAEVTEDFESYDEMAIVENGETMGPWTGWDVDGGQMYGWNGGNWPYIGTTAAFGIYNQDAIFDGKLGNGGYNESAQALMFMAVNRSTSATGANDDWFVSPELSGVAQTISFMLSELSADFGNEKYEILASSTGNTPECFTKVAEGEASMEWTEVSAQLPEGTKFFAIRCLSNEAFVMLVDDLKYTAGGSNPVGFNIYLDQVNVGVAEADARSFTITEEVADGEHEVAVTAVYANGESAPKAVTLTTSGIQNINANDAKTVIYNVNGVRVEKANKPGVYVINGRKAVVK